MKREKLLDLDILNRVVERMITVIEKSQHQVFDIAETARTEYRQAQLELEETRFQVTEIIQQVDKMEREVKQARLRLMEVSRDIHRYTEEDIRQAYELAWEAQVQLSVLREKESNLLKRRDELERRLKRVAAIAEKAETLINQIGFVLKYIRGDLEELKNRLGKYQKQQQLGWWIITAQEEERKRVAREIHDGPAQALANIFMRLEYCSRLWEIDIQQAKQEMEELKKIVKESLQELRKIIFDLRPYALDDLGLIPVLKRYFADFEARYQLPVSFVQIGNPPKLQPALEIALFRLIQEALANAYKHAAATAITVKLEFTSQWAIAVIRDNGKGFEPSLLAQKQKSHYGLLNMQERVELLEGSFELKSEPGKGTEIRVRIPLREKEAPPLPALNTREVSP